MPLRLMRFGTTIFFFMLFGCARISLTEGDSGFASIIPAMCDTGEPAVNLMSITSRLTGETRRLPWVKATRTSPIFVKPGTYEIEVGCSRGKTECGLSKGLFWVYMDSGPRVTVSLDASQRVELDCDGANSAIKVLR